MQDPHHAALAHMRMALVMLDEHGPSLCAAYLSHAVEKLAEQLIAQDPAGDGSTAFLEFAEQRPQAG